MMVLQLKAFVVCVLLLAVVEPAKLPNKASDNDMTVSYVLKSDGCRGSHNATVADNITSSFEEQTVKMLKKFYRRFPMMRVSVHPNGTNGTSQTNHPLERQLIKRNAGQCVRDPVLRCEKNRDPRCLINFGCKGRGSCGGTCREVRLPHTVLRLKGVHNGQYIWQPDVILVSADCVCT